jgi:phenylacetate-coenzyme A ligase PaaK-like adenylate-forming protein
MQAVARVSQLVGQVMVMLVRESGSSMVLHESVGRSGKRVIFMVVWEEVEPKLCTDWEQS